MQSNAKHLMLFELNVCTKWYTLFKKNKLGRQFNQQTMHRLGNQNTKMNVCNSKTINQSAYVWDTRYWPGTDRFNQMRHSALLIQFYVPSDLHYLKIIRQTFQRANLTPAGWLKRRNVCIMYLILKLSIQIQQIQI